MSSLGPLIWTPGPSIWTSVVRRYGSDAAARRHAARHCRVRPSVEGQRSSRQLTRLTIMVPDDRPACSCGWRGQRPRWTAAGITGMSARGQGAGEYEPDSDGRYVYARGIAWGAGQWSATRYVTDDSLSCPASPSPTPVRSSSPRSPTTYPWRTRNAGSTADQRRSGTGRSAGMADQLPRSRSSRQGTGRPDDRDGRTTRYGAPSHLTWSTYPGIRTSNLFEA